MRHNTAARFLPAGNGDQDQSSISEPGRGPFHRKARLVSLLMAPSESCASPHGTWFLIEKQHLVGAPETPQHCLSGSCNARANCSFWELAPNSS